MWILRKGYIKIQTPTSIPWEMIRYTGVLKKAISFGPPARKTPPSLTTACTTCEHEVKYTAVSMEGPTKCLPLQRAEEWASCHLEGLLHLSGCGGVVDLSVHMSAAVVESEVLVPTTDTDLEFLHLLSSLPDELLDNAFRASAASNQPSTPTSTVYTPRSTPLRCPFSCSMQLW